MKRGKLLRNSRWAVLWGLFLVLLHLIPGRMLPHLPTYLDLLQPDKLVHVGMFAIFTWMMIAAFTKEGNPLFFTRRPVLAAFLIALLFGTLMELIQNYLIPNRFGDVYDLIADMAGGFAGWGLWALAGKIFRRTELP